VRFEKAHEYSEDLGSWAEMKSWLLVRKIWLLSVRESNHISPLQNNFCTFESLTKKKYASVGAAKRDAALLHYGAAATEKRVNWTGSRRSRERSH